MKIKLWIVVLVGLVLAFLLALSVKVGIGLHSDKMLAIDGRNGCLEIVYELGRYSDSIQVGLIHEIHSQDSIIYERDRVLGILGTRNMRLELIIAEMGMEIYMLKVERDSLASIVPPKPCLKNNELSHPVIK